MFWKGFCTEYDNFAIFSFWDMVDFVLNIRGELIWYFDKFRKKIITRRPGARMLLDWIPLSLVSVSESGSQKSLKFSSSLLTTVEGGWKSPLKNLQKLEEKFKH